MLKACRDNWMKILLTGANGYIGKRLLPVLLKKGHEVFCLLRSANRFQVHESYDEFPGKYRLIVGDLLDAETLSHIPKDIDAAYYLVHSMSSLKQDFYDIEEQAAKNFVYALSQTSAKQIIYLSGIVNDIKLSKHLKSRLNVEKILKSSTTQVTVLRAAIIIGSGSASFEIIRDLVEKLPVMICPKWVKTKCQPIAIRDVIRYLLGVLLKEEALDRVFDIGGRDVLSYKDMMLRYAKLRGLKRYIIDVPVMTPRLSSYWLYFITSTNFPLAVSLVDSMKNEVVCKHLGIDSIVPGQALSYESALKLAMSKIAQNDVASSWKDALITGVIRENFLDDVEVPKYGCYKDTRVIELDNPDKVFENIVSIGGKRGWYYAEFLWELRGFIDKLAGGVGLRRGRRDPKDLRMGDALDFWRVILIDKDHRRLILYAEMKLPGEAWLEFHVFEESGKFYLKQEASFRPSGVLGRFYWYALLPLHIIIFRGMVNKLVSS